MAEYIEREAVCYQLAKQATIDGQPRAIKRAAKIVANIPAADVVPMDFHERCLQIEIQKRMALEKADVRPVVKAEWYGEADGYADGELVYDMWSCPVCGKRFEEWEEKPDWNFCPNCGADMREES